MDTFNNIKLFNIDNTLMNSKIKIDRITTPKITTPKITTPKITIPKFKTFEYENIDNYYLNLYSKIPHHSLR